MILLCKHPEISLSLFLDFVLIPISTSRRLKFYLKNQNSNTWKTSSVTHSRVVTHRILV